MSETARERALNCATRLICDPGSNAARPATPYERELARDLLAVLGELETARTERDDYLGRVDEVNVERQRQEVRAIEAEAQVETLKEALRAVNDNALGWHAGEEGKARALNAIAVWTSEALAGRVHRDVALITADRAAVSEPKEPQ